MSAVTVQPRDDGERDAALRALVACPVGAIGDLAHRPVGEAVAAFPMTIDGPVSYLGFNARDSFSGDHVAWSRTTAKLRALAAARAQTPGG